MTDDQKRGRGRPATYDSDAERAKAWRERQRKLVEQAQAMLSQPALTVEEAKPKLKQKHTGKVTAARQPDAEVVGPMLRKRLEGGEHNLAKSLRTKAAATATFARELLETLKPDQRSISKFGKLQCENLPGLAFDDPEKQFLEQIEEFFTQLNSELVVTQRVAKLARQDKERELEERMERDLQALEVTMFGPFSTLESVQATARDLLRFCKTAEPWVKARHKTQHVLMPSQYEIHESIRLEPNLAQVRRRIAKFRVECTEKGHWGPHWDSRVNEQCYFVGWDTVDAWLAEQRGAAA